MKNNFNLQSTLDQIYSRFPVAERRPVIGITGNYEELTCKLGRGYYDSVARAGGVPLVIPPIADAATLAGTLDRIDGLLLSGGADINPLFQNSKPPMNVMRFTLLINLKILLNPKNQKLSTLFLKPINSPIVQNFLSHNKKSFTIVFLMPVNVKQKLKSN